MSRLRLAWRLLIRDWRDGEPRLLVAALLIAVASITSVSMLADRLQHKFKAEAADLMGADLSVSSHRPLPDMWRVQAAGLGLKFAQITGFSSVLVENGQFLLTGVRSVSRDYPLRGELRIAETASSPPEVTRQPPHEGEAWADDQILKSLGLHIGEIITVGEKPLRLTRIILEEPGFKGGFSSLTPRLIINQDDLPATRIVQPGSRVDYQILFTGEAEALSRMKDWLKPQLQPGDQLSDLEQDRPELGKVIQRSERYLGMVSVAIVLVAGLAIALSVRRHTEKRFDLIALLKCMGASHRDVLGICLWQLAIIGVTVSLIGCLAGWMLQNLFAFLVRDFLPQGLHPPGLSSWFSGMTLGCLILFGISIPALLGLKRIPPSRVLRRELITLPSSGIQLSALGLAVPMGLAWHYGGTGMTLAGIAAGGLLLLASLGGILRLVLTLMKRMAPRLPLPLRLGIQHVTRQPRLSLNQIMAYSLTLAAMLIILTVRTELIQTWRNQLPAQTPNHFALNLFDKDIEPFRAFMRENGLASSELYPIVRGRLIKVNQVDVSEILRHDSRAESSINRELSLTWTSVLPPDNRIVTGTWHDASKPGVSVEKALAEKLGIHAGDTLTFSIAGEPLQTIVTSLRSVQWDSMRPNFFMIFSPHQLESRSHTWVTSFYVPPTQTSSLARLGKTFPAITLLDVDAVIRQLQSVLHQVTLIVEFLLLLALAAGFILMLASIKATLDQRIQEDALLRTLGATRSLLRRVQWVEFSSLGLLAGLVATTLSELAIWSICRYWLEIAPRFHWEIWLLTPLLASLAISLTGQWSTRHVLKKSPLSVLQHP